MSRRRERVASGDAVLDILVDGQGPAIVLLPSALRDSEDYHVLAASIAREGFQVLRPQPRGMGGSSPPPPGMTLDTLADDVARVIAALAAGPAVVVGHAYGHWVARRVDLRHPALVRGVVVLGGAARQFPAGMPEAMAIASDPARPEQERLAALSLCMFAAGNDPRPWLEGWYPQWRQAFRAAAASPPRDTWVDRGRTPLLDLQGAEDPWRPPASRDELRDALGDKVTVQVIPRASHALVPEQPGAVAEAIVAWTRRLPRN